MFTIFKPSNQDEPARLHKVEEEDTLTNIQEIIVKIGVILFLILLALLFIIFCFLVQPPTYGFFVW